MSSISWPPRLVRTDVLGEVVDVNARKYRRDIGRAVHLGGNTYYAFGDTFCHGDHGNFCGVTNNTIAHVPHPAENPATCEYGHRNDLTPPFVDFTKSELEYTNHPAHKQNNDRVCLWSFGGIIPDSPNSSTGWVLHDKLLTHGAEGGKWFGMGVARASVGHNKVLKLDRPMGDIMIFGEEEPHFGSHSHLVDDDGWVYLLGSQDAKAKDLDLRSHLARIRQDADFTQRSNYEVLVSSPDGKGTWAKSYNHVDDLQRLGELDGYGMGALFKSPSSAFAPPGRPYLWVGVNKFMAGKFYIGSAPSITGPWEVHDLGDLPNDPDGPSGGAKYALYPNPEASRLDRGELICTWTDATEMGGKVIAARFWFEGGFEALPPAQALRREEQKQGHGDWKAGIKDGLKGKLEGFLKR